MSVKKKTSHSAPIARRSRGRFWRRLAVIATVLIVFAGAGIYGLQALERYSIRRQALHLASQGDHERAEPLLKQLVNWNPNDAEAVRALALLQMRPGRLMALAEPYITRWCIVAPDDSDAFRSRMHLRVKMKQREKALADGRRALELQPENQAIRRAVASLLVHTGRPIEAEKQIRRCLKGMPGDPQLQFLLAENYRFQGQDETAQAVLDNLLRDHPQYPEALVLRGRLWNEAKKFDKAIDLFRRILNDETAHIWHQTARYQLSHALHQSGKKRDAEKILQENRRVEKVEHLYRDAGQQLDNITLGLKAAEGLLDIGQPRRALGWLKKLAKHYPNHRRVHLLVAECYNALGDVGKAKTHRLSVGAKE